MQVSVIIDLSVISVDKHVKQLLSAARYLTNDLASVEVTPAPDGRKQIQAWFSVPDARQGTW